MFLQTASYYDVASRLKEPNQETSKKHLKAVLNMGGRGESEVSQESTIQLLESRRGVLCIGLQKNRGGQNISAQIIVTEPDRCSLWGSSLVSRAVASADWGWSYLTSLCHMCSQPWVGKIITWSSSLFRQTCSLSPLPSRFGNFTPVIRLPSLLPTFRSKLLSFYHCCKNSHWTHVCAMYNGCLASTGLTLTQFLLLVNCGWWTKSCEYWWKALLLISLSLIFKQTQSHASWARQQDWLLKPIW